MSNQFKLLDSIFPCGKDRTSGEVVGITIMVTVTEGNKVYPCSEMYWKRKAWYCNASVNAFHMHRGLCREFREDFSTLCLISEHKTVRSMLADAVMWSYLGNNINGKQAFVFELNFLNKLPKLYCVEHSTEELEVKSELDSDDVRSLEILRLAEVERARLGVFPS